MDDKKELTPASAGCSVADEFAKQLHEQYAVNDNAKSSNVISFITAIAFVFVGFGYVYVQPYISKSDVSGAYPSLLLSVDILANVIFVLMAILCVTFGSSTRRDHVVVTRIRQQYASGYLYDWFNGKYNGCGKSLLNYLPDYYMIMFLFIQLFVILLAVGCKNNIEATEMSPCCWLFIALLSIIINVAHYFYHYCKYLFFLKEKERNC